eukprot:10065331-Alexandrium_andersonii.AAC.1
MPPTSPEYLSCGAARTTASTHNVAAGGMPMPKVHDAGCAVVGCLLALIGVCRHRQPFDARAYTRTHLHKNSKLIHSPASGYFRWSDPAQRRSARSSECGRCRSKLAASVGSAR